MQKYHETVITLYNEPATDLGQLGLCFQIIETVYATACKQLKISEHSPQIVSLDIKSTHIEISVKGLKTAIQLTKGVVEHPSGLLKTMKTDFIEKRENQKTALSTLFENVSTGIDKIDEADLQDVINNSIGYNLSRWQTG